jgi:hypothetical protein
MTMTEFQNRMIPHSLQTTTMTKTNRSVMKALTLLCSMILLARTVSAQTDLDGIMMNKNQFCNGLTYENASWKNYWEGKLKRENLNMGRVTTQNVMIMPNFGITDNLNVMAALPYVWTNASAGTLHGMKGIQDLSVHVKWRFLKHAIGKGKLSLFAIGGLSTPLSDYVIDFLPLSIGLGSTNLTGRFMADYSINRISVTGSAAYIYRSNVKIDRTSYYDTQLHLTNEVNMPDQAQFQLRAGYRGKFLIAEAMVTNMTTLGGFDITRNNMPFPSNRMNMTSIGLGLKYTLPKFTNLALVAGGDHVLMGRNVGQTTSFHVGAFYAFYFGKHKNS